MTITERSPGMASAHSAPRNGNEEGDADMEKSKLLGEHVNK